MRPIKHPIQRDLDALETQMQAITEEFERAPSTVQTYGDHWRAFQSWCEEVGRMPLPATEETVAAYHATRAASGYAPSTIDIDAAAISWHHQHEGVRDPTKGHSKLTRQGIARTSDHVPRRATPLTAKLTEQAVKRGGRVPGVGALRHRAALTVGYCHQVPLLELSLLTREDIADHGDSITLTLPGRSMKHGRAAISPRRVEVWPVVGPLCPLEALRSCLGSDGGRDPLPFQGKPSAIMTALRTAADRAGVAFNRTPYPGERNTEEEVWRVFTYLDMAAVRDVRDRAYLLLGHAGAFRSGEPPTLLGRHVHRFPDGIVIKLPFSKTDQFGRGEYVGISRAPDPQVCPVVALEQWMTLFRIGPADPLMPALGGHNPGEAFTTQTVQKIVKGATSRAGVDGVFSGNSLRRGFAGSAAEAGETLLSISTTLRHKKMSTTRKYVEPQKLTERRAVGELGL